MKRPVIAILAIIVGYWEFADDLESWLPPFGITYGGHVIGQAVILGFVAAVVFGTVV